MKNTNYIPALVSAALILLCANSCGIYGTYKSDTPQEIENIQVPSYTEIFNEPELISLIDTALAHNLNLKMAHERVRQADLQFTAAKLAYLPHIYVGGSPAAQISGAKGSQPNITYTFGTASWEIDIFGRTTNRKRIAKAIREEAADYEQAARAELIAAVATLYYNLQMLDAQILAMDIGEANWKESVDAMKDMKEAGLADEAGVSQFEGSYYATKANGKSLRLVRTLTENSLLYLLGTDSGEIKRGRIFGSSEERQINSQPIQDINLQAVRIRPDVKAAEMQLVQAFYNVNLARANCCPSINIGGTVGWSNGNLLFGAIGGLLQPLFNAGENITQVKVSKSRLEEYQLAYADALLNAGTEVNNAIASIKSYQDRMDDCANRVEAMTRALESTQLLMKFGRGTYLEVLVAQNDLLSAQVAELQNKADILTSTVELFHALGGGSR